MEIPCKYFDITKLTIRIICYSRFTMLFDLFCRQSVYFHNDIVTRGDIIIRSGNMRANLITCLNCRLPVKPRKITKCTRKTHIAAVLLTPFLLCFLPYVMQTCKNIIWECPICGVRMDPSNESECSSKCFF